MNIRIEIGPPPHAEWSEGREFIVPASVVRNHADWKYHTSELLRTLDEVDTGFDPVGRFMLQVGEAISTVAAGGPRVDLLLQGAGRINAAGGVEGDDRWTLAVAVYSAD